MVDVDRPARKRRLGVLALASLALMPGCGVVPRARFDESQQLAQSLRAENAGLKDRLLGLQAQNRDYADRALDDLRRLTARDEAIERLERSVQAYQEDRDRLAGAYRRLAMTLGRPAEDGHAEPTADRAGPASGRGRAVRADLREGGQAAGPTGRADGPGEGRRPRGSPDGSGP